MQTTQSIAELVGGELDGPGDLSVSGVQMLELAQPDELTFIGDRRFAKKWADAKCRAALVTEGIDLPKRNDVAVIRVANADLAMAKVLELFAPPIERPPVGVHPSSVIDASATLGRDVRIGPMCVVGPRVVVGDGCTLHAHVSLSADAKVGNDCEFYPGAVVGQRCTLGDRCILHPNSLVGGDGFGYRPDPQRHVPVKIPQIGTVQLGDDVEIGAGTCIDRGKFAATTIGNHVKIDNLVQIGHNCIIGDGTIIAGLSAIAGSVTIGRGVLVGGGSHFSDHLTVGDGAKIAGSTALMTDIPAGETWGGSPALPMKEALRQEAAVRKLPKLLRELKRK